MASTSQRQRRRSRVVAILLAGLCAILLHAHVYTAFERLRFGIVRTAAQAAVDGAVAVPLPDLSPLADQPIAIVLRLSADRSALRVARVAVGGATLAEVPLAPGREVRVDLSLPGGAAPAAGDTVEVMSDGDGWALTYLEVANVHGFSRGLVEFMVVPAPARPADRPGVLLSMVLFLLMLRFPRPPAAAVRNRFVRVAYVVAAGLVGLFLGTVLVAPFVSDYGVLLARHTFLALLAVLYYPALDAVGRDVLPALRNLVVRRFLPASRDFVVRRSLPALRNFVVQLFHLLRRA